MDILTLKVQPPKLKVYWEDSIVSTNRQKKNQQT